MPTDLTEVETGSLSLLFPDELSGTEFRLSEASVYDAEEVREEIESDTPEFGRWLPVEANGDGEGFANAPGELLEELKRLEAEAGESFVITRCEKAGDDDTAPYEVNVERLGEDAQSRL